MRIEFFNVLLIVWLVLRIPSWFVPLSIKKDCVVNCVVSLGVAPGACPFPDNFVLKKVLPELPDLPVEILSDLPDLPVKLPNLELAEA
jgi:hypothetical protein